jgi:hypothetical protein
MDDALLLTMMSAAPDGDEEFNAWADTEHLPERRRLPGFRTALRFRNATASPRYLAIYDLVDLSVLETDAYRAIAGENLSPWSKRNLARATARWRFAGSRIGAERHGPATGETAPIVEILVVTWRGIPVQLDDGVVDSMASCMKGLRSVSQVRIFVGGQQHALDYVAIVEATARFPDEAVVRDRLRLDGRACDFAQTFTPMI